jgi:hypothetical protein
MASRRFIQKFDRLNAETQRHLEEQTDLYLDMGLTRPADVVPFAAEDRQIMLKAELHSDVASYFPARFIPTPLLGIRAKRKA